MKCEFNGFQNPRAPHYIYKIVNNQIGIFYLYIFLQGLPVDRKFTFLLLLQRSGLTSSALPICDPGAAASVWPPLLPGFKFEFQCGAITHPIVVVWNNGNLQLTHNFLTITILGDFLNKMKLKVARSKGSRNGSDFGIIIGTAHTYAHVYVRISPSVPRSHTDADPCKRCSS